MNSRRQVTTLPTDQPVRFYKIIALTFLVITVGLLGVIIFMSSKRAVVTVFTKKTPVDVTTDLSLSLQETSINGVEYMATSTEMSVEEIFFPTGTKEEPGEATGYVTLHNTSGSVQPLVATTRLLSGDSVLFRIKEGVSVPANGTLERVEVYSDIEGAENNIAPSTFTIPGLSATRQKEVYAVSDEVMKGGVRTIGVLSKKDIDAAKAEMKEKVIAKAETTLRSAGTNDMVALYDVGSLQVVSDTEAGKEVSEFRLSGKATVIGVFYQEDNMGQWARDQLMKRAIDNSELVRPSEAMPTITFGGYDQYTDEVTLHVFFDGTVTLNPEGKQIEKTMFFGKTKDEARRYLLSLDHVHKVEVEFHPAWMRTVPHINDHVTVYVQEVE
ncbi:MAG: hypothetical protein HOE80_01725 [Candidatus Magasanikbacteria bacterium]|jgi:hypothetical protein|nr:hypothetical protein [Candidatus Magasanikbacteria bacterium]MBT4071421.1 hypothetical protein [Candidatus Magasanikbacteria bacterium]